MAESKVKLEDVLRSAAASVLGAPVDLFNAVMPSAVASKLGTSEGIRKALGGGKESWESQKIGETLASIVPAGALSKGAYTALKQAKNIKEVMAGIRADDLLTIKKSLGETLARQEGIHAGQMARLKAVDDWLNKNAMPSGYNDMPGLPFRSAKNPEYGVLVARDKLDKSLLGQDYRNSISSTPKVYYDIQGGLNRKHAADAAMKIQDGSQSGHLFQNLPAPIEAVSAHALPVDSRIASLFYDLQQKEGKAYGNNQVMVDAVYEALKRGLIKEVPKK